MKATGKERGEKLAAKKTIRNFENELLGIRH
jgi:hypothetical protein